MWKRLYSIALDGLDGESIKISYMTGCSSLFRLLQQNTSGWCLRNSRNLLITPHGCVLAKALFRLLTQTRCVLTGWKGREVSSLFEETSPIHEDRADHPPKAPLPNTITFGIRVSTYEFQGRDINIQSMTDRVIQFTRNYKY